jgi:hypothetical protein
MSASSPATTRCGKAERGTRPVVLPVLRRRVDLRLDPIDHRRSLITDSCAATLRLVRSTMA